MNIKVHRGQNQIGGNIIEISTNTSRILLDVGLELDNEKNKVLPDIPGLFDHKGFDAIFITHYHGDHIGLAYKTHIDIPIFMGEKSYKIVKASDDYKGIASLSPQAFLVHKKYIQIRDIKVTPYLCDHSAFDSYMLLCESESETVLYTGDFRSNGRKPYEWLLSELPNKVDTLICEGTTLSREDYVAEYETDLEEKAVKLFKEHSGPVFVLQSSMNIDRLVTMYRAAKRTNRVFLQDLYLADITSAIGGSIPNPSFEDVYVFITNSRRFEQLTKYKKRIGKEKIAQKHFVMCVRTPMSKYLKSLSNVMSFKDGLLIYSLWSGYKEDPEMKEFLSECESMGLKIITLHTSGHADEKAIKMLIEKTNPTQIIPVHTLNAEWFEDLKCRK